MYGLTELHREAVRGARLVANPGCYPTSVQLPLCPLLEVHQKSTAAGPLCHALHVVIIDTESSISPPTATLMCHGRAHATSFVCQENFAIGRNNSKLYT